VRNPDDTLTPENYYLDFALGMQQIGYDGYVGYELCHPLPKIGGRTVGIEFADENARLASEYMRAIAKQAVAANQRRERERALAGAGGGPPSLGLQRMPSYGELGRSLGEGQAPAQSK
jgi:hypothetical protein